VSTKKIKAKKKPVAAKSNWGGVRSGAGRPTIGDEKMIRVQVMLDSATKDRALKLGEGNLSAGVRIAFSRLRVV
jgi:hypothetical protein